MRARKTNYVENLVDCLAIRWDGARASVMPSVSTLSEYRSQKQKKKTREGEETFAAERGESLREHNVKKDSGRSANFKLRVVHGDKTSHRSL